MKGIILAGGSGTRLFPATKSISKQIIPVYDKPMIYYPLSALMLSGIREILIISTPKDIHLYEELLGDGHQIGLSLSYKVQHSPDGLAQAFLIGEDFLGKDPVCLILGDNIFYGHGFGKTLLDIGNNFNSGATVFGYYVRDPERYGVVEFDSKGSVLSLEEKPSSPKSNYAVTGLYFYDNTVVEKAKSLKPSKRGELEITDLNRLYLNENNLSVKLLGRGLAWLDTGTPGNLIDAGNFIRAIELRQGRKIACLEEIALRLKFISDDKFLDTVNALPDSNYKKYCITIYDELKNGLG